jgi:hypothetical protein
MPQFAYPMDASELVQTPEPWKLELRETQKYDIASIKYVIKRSDQERAIYKIDRWEIIDGDHSKPRQWVLHFAKRRYCPSHVIKQVDECLSSELNHEHIGFLEDMLFDSTMRPSECVGTVIAGPLSFEEAKKSVARYYGAEDHQVFISIKS